MYLWLVNQTAGDSLIGGVNIPRYVLTSSKQPDDAIYRLKEAYETERETLNEVRFLGYIPALAETYASPTGRPKIFYVKAAYSLPQSPQLASNVRRVVTSFFERIDNNLPLQLSLTSEDIGPIPTGPADALDVAMIGVVLALPTDTPEAARQLIQSHVFNGQIDENNIRIMVMRRVLASVV